MLTTSTVNDKDHFMSKWDKHLTSFMKDEFWTAVRLEVTQLKITSGLEFMYADSSLTIHNKKRTRFVKITTGGEVQVERRINAIDFKSKKYRFDNLKEAVERFSECAHQQFPLPTVA
jgi:hypothetical protein